MGVSNHAGYNTPVYQTLNKGRMRWLTVIVCRGDVGSLWEDEFHPGDPGTER